MRGGALCAVRGASRTEGGGQTDRRQSIASTRVEVQHRAPAAYLAPARITNTPGTNSHTCCAGRGTAWYVQAGDAVPECTVWQAATNGRVPAKYSLQPTIPYAPMPRLHINLTVSKTAALHGTLGSYGLNRPQYKTCAPRCTPRVPRGVCQAVCPLCMLHWVACCHACPHMCKPATDAVRSAHKCACLPVSCTRTDLGMGLKRSGSALRLRLQIVLRSLILF